MLQHISYSSLALFTNNPLAWHRKYVLGIRDQKTTPAALTGVAFHKYAEMKMQGIEPALALYAAKVKITEVTDVDWGKTGSPEKCEAKLLKLIEAWEREYVCSWAVKEIEVQLCEKIKGLKTPLFGYSDCIVEREGKLGIIDWKTTDTLEDTLKPAHKVQGYFYKWLAEKKYKMPVEAFTVVQVKASENKDGSPQVKELPFIFADNLKEEVAAKRLVKEALKQMTRKGAVPTPNLRDDYDGESAWNAWVESCSLSS